MAKRRLHISWFGLIVLLLSANMLFAQKAPVSYYFEGEDVVFQFDSRDYDIAELKGTTKQLDFEDLDIYQVAISGNFNNWSKEGWKMQKVGPSLFQLRKKIKDFDDDFTPEFKFIINRRYWTKPEGAYKDRIYGDDFWTDIFDTPLYDVSAVENGNSTFYLAGYSRAKEVILTGSFNGWDEHFLEMKKVASGWELSLELPPGRYEYKFIADGEWLHDPANPEKVRNQYLTFNSVLNVTRTVDFYLEGFTDAKQVILAGSFNDWDERKTKMQRTESGWKLSLDLIGGKQYYKFIVDGEWMVDPNNPYKENDGSGNINSVLIIQ